MLAPVTIVAVLLPIVSYLYLRAKEKHMSVIFRSATNDILLADTVLSLAISYWIVSSDVAFDCDGRPADFLINVCNGIFYSVFLAYLASELIKRPGLVNLCVKTMVPTILIGCQIVLAAVAHFSEIGIKGRRSTVRYCYGERSGTAVKTSYCYGFALLVLCVALLFAKLWRKWKQTPSRGTLMIGNSCHISFCIAVAVTYSLALSFVLWSNDETDCANHASFLVILALYPAILSLSYCVGGLAKTFYRKKRRRSFNWEQTGMTHVHDFLVPWS